MSIEALDILYVPSRDVAADLRFYRDVLGARVVFARWRASPAAGISELECLIMHL